MSDRVNAVARPKNAFQFVSVAAARAKQLQVGCIPKVEGSAKVARRAQQEVSEGAVKATSPGPDDATENR